MWCWFMKEGTRAATGQGFCELRRGVGVALLYCCVRSLVMDLRLWYVIFGVMRLDVWQWGITINNRSE